MKSLSYIINCIHPVYEGYLSFFSKYYNMSLYGTFSHFIDKQSFYQKHSNIKIYEFIKYKICCGALYLFNKNNINIKNQDLVIVGDTFTNNLSYRLHAKNVIYYGEYIPYKGKTIKNILFYILGFIFFYNKKIIVPTKLSYEAYSKFSKKVFYFPQLFCDELTNNIEPKKNSTINLLIAVNDLSSKSKNIEFVIINYLKFRNKYKDTAIHLNLVGNIIDKNFLDPFYNEIKNKIITHIGFLNKDDLNKLYQETDIFLLPSIREPIGSVVMEALSNSCAVLTSNMVGASCYIEDGLNGYVFTVDSSDDFIEKLLLITKDVEYFKENAFKIIKEKYRFRNTSLTDKLYTEFSSFIGNKNHMIFKT